MREEEREREKGKGVEREGKGSERRGQRWLWREEDGAFLVVMTVRFHREWGEL